MTNYSDIEIQAANNLLKNGYKWIVRNRTGKLLVYSSKPSHIGKLWLSDDYDYGYSICEKYVPIFKNVHFGDKEPTSLENIVHPQILDDVEKQYLKGVIRPFRDKVLYIVKRSINDFTAEYICIQLAGLEYICLPHFKKGTLYKDMETNRCYKLEELGL